MTASRRSPRSRASTPKRKRRARQATQNRIGLSERLNRAQEEERRRLSQEIHDQVGAWLAVQMVHLRSARNLVGSGALERADGEIAKAIEIALQLQGTARNIQVALRPESLNEMGLPAALEALRRVFEGAGLKVHLQVESVRQHRFDPDVETAAFRILQHALTNVLRHSGVDTANATIELVSAARGERLRVTVEDKGRGFSPEAIASRTGMAAMADRAAIVGGTLAVEAAPGRGARVTAELPVSSRRTPLRPR